MYVRWKDERKSTIKVAGEKKGSLGVRRERASAKKIGKSFLDALWGLLIPIIILGGIYGGIFTPTEAAVVSVVYGLFVGMFIYRTLNLKKLYAIFVDASVQTAVIMFFLSTASIFSYIVTPERYAIDNYDLFIIIFVNLLIHMLLLCDL